MAQGTLLRIVIVGFAAAAFVIGSALMPTFAQDTVPYASRPSAGDAYVPTLGCQRQNEIHELTTWVFDCAII